jgi:hypothetical protein
VKNPSTPKFIECTKCRKLVPIDELASHSKQHSEETTSKDHSDSLAHINKDQMINDIQSWLSNQYIPSIYKPFSYLKSQMKFRFKNIHSYGFFQ